MLKDKLRRGFRARTMVPMALCALLAGLGSPAAAQSGRLSIDGVARSYLLHPPARRPAESRPLVLVLHGAGGTPAGIAEHTGFSRLADREGFLVAYPAARSGRWQDGRAGAESAADVEFLRALIDTLRRQHAVDSTRIYLAGISNGGMMAWRLACVAPKSIAAIGVVAAPMPARLAGTCAAAPPVSVIALHGTSDGLAPYAGGPALLSAPESADRWARRLGCDPASGPIRTDRVTDGTAIDHLIYAECDRGAVELYSIRGGGHTWPGGPRVRLRTLGRTTREIDATAVLWDFFRRHPR
ncbi:MAG TPA: PHB depolymerase family esterase [Gemmatimonadales bacterium]|nr:PHB depolymerase family esterase [Gemmatimonadales bacterium]